MEFLQGSLYYDLLHRCDGFLSRLDSIEEIEGDLQLWANTINDKIDELDAADLISRCGTLEENYADLALRNDFTNDYKSKLDGIASNATANDTDSNLKNRANHTGEQAISTITSLESTLSGYNGRITALESWKSVMPKRCDRYTATTDANGDITVSFPGGRYTSVPEIALSFVFNNDNYGSFYNIKSLSKDSLQIRVMRNKNSAVLLGGNIDPDEALSSTPIVVTAIEF